LIYSCLAREGLAKAQLVVRKSHCDFRQPIACDLIARCAIPPHVAHDFINHLQVKGKARIAVGIEIFSDAGEHPALCADNLYVALQEPA
jgi:hypothetical protein